MSPLAKTLMQGNEAVAEGAMLAGMTYFAGYPITPASEILQYLVKVDGMRAVQFEDEISSIHAIIGASLAGARAMTATSGPGFSLMQEGIGLAHMMEVPLVVVDVQRVGPSTGMPTLPAQGDVLQAAYGSHGDYFPIVFYPNCVQELYDYSIKAFNAAEDSRSPVILLSDGYIGHLYETINVVTKAKQARRKLRPLGVGGRHFTGLTSWNDVPTPQDPDTHRRVIAKLAAKQRDVAHKYEAYEYLRCPKADTLVVCFGSLSRAIAPLAGRYSVYRPILMYPAVDALTEIASRYKRTVVVEMNAGQYVRVVQRLVKTQVLSLPVIGGDLDVLRLEERLAWITRHS
jgi:2-oxoglutarate ferredoxin oxidoreductase subunit alpha